MNPSVLISKLKESNTLHNIAQKYTLIVTENEEEHGALFFIPVGGKEFKVIIPAPYHKEFLDTPHITTYGRILNHNEAAILK